MLLGVPCTLLQHRQCSASLHALIYVLQWRVVVSTPPSQHLTPHRLQDVPQHRLTERMGAATRKWVRERRGRIRTRGMEQVHGHTSAFPVILTSALDVDGMGVNRNLDQHPLETLTSYAWPGIFRSP